PDWIREALQYFALIDGGDGWRKLVREWLVLERKLGFPTSQDSSNRLPNEHRPEEVKLWMKNHRSYEKLPRIKSPSQFATAWKQWWVSLQPASRVADGSVWPLPLTEPADTDEWRVVARGGCNGFFLLLLTLAWW
ncbi:hypothetical protein FKP32DRAFT_1529614, partial [Trametes sanguinea]